MKLLQAILSLGTAVLFVQASLACPRTSASYSVSAETADAGGSNSSSASYSNTGSAGGTAGVSGVASPAETLKSGFIAQLPDVTALQLAASLLTINETGTRQISAVQLLDDATTNNLLATSVSWSVLSGPITSINASGLATAATVAQDTAASVQGTFGGITGSLNLTVLDTIQDNFGSYAGDGIGDDWQIQYFGANNSNAAPSVISDGSGLTNLFKYTAGLIPNNSASRFDLGTQSVSGQAAQKTISFGPTFADRQYTILYSTDLLTWNPLTSSLAGNGAVTTVTDTNGGGQMKFYRIQMVKP